MDSQLQERYDLLQMAANKLRDLAVAAIQGDEDDRNRLEEYLFGIGELDAK